MLIKFWFIHCQIMPEAAQTHEFASCTHLPKHYLWAFHLWTLEVDPISCQNPECRRLVKSHLKNLLDWNRSIMSASSSEMFVDHVSNLSSSKKSILGLSFLLFQAESPVEERFWDYPFQRRRSLRIKHLKNSGTQALQLTATSWDGPLIWPPLLLWSTTSREWDSLNEGILRSWTSSSNTGIKKCQGIYRNASGKLIPGQFNHTTLKINSFCVRGRIPSSKLPDKSWCRYCTILRVSFQHTSSLSNSSCIHRYRSARSWRHILGTSKECWWWFIWSR